MWASPANAGAERLANELASAFAGLSVSTSDTPEQATHMLLYLNEETWSDERLGEQVKQARADKLPIVMAHENDPTRGGCLFAKFFETTPQELIAGGLYSSQVARSCFPGRHHEARANPHRRVGRVVTLHHPCSLQVSLVLVAKSLGATPTKAQVDLRRSGSFLRRTLGVLRSSSVGSVSTVEPEAEPSEAEPSEAEPSAQHHV